MDLPDLQRIEGFQWDAGNARKNDKHGVTPKEAEEVFADPRLLILEDPGHSQAEVRYRALGVTPTGRLLHVTFTMREEGRWIRVISARPMNWRERPFYENQEAETDSPVQD